MTFSDFYKFSENKFFPLRVLAVLLCLTGWFQLKFLSDQEILERVVL